MLSKHIVIALGVIRINVGNNIGVTKVITLVVT